MGTLRSAWLRVLVLGVLSDNASPARPTALLEAMLTDRCRMQYGLKSSSLVLRFCHCPWNRSSGAAASASRWTVR
ncbi:hypothetical protein SUDANB135_00142 [Streptomyces sp. SudanB135_2055]